MARRQPDDQPDAVVHSDDGSVWEYLCSVCMHASRVRMPTSRVAYFQALRHLNYSHGINRVWIEIQTVGYREAVNVALPLVVEHDLTLPADRYTR